ncbi:serine protease [Dysgonomonas sp. 521]|uniref:S1 family peptidase n=1 Tax=Dysgonomonas sp. 521 TaxID=2302932 RepID=UPI0013D3A4F0|nr:serine protease [Dysgonomonas sp. 521]NDV94750.1 serine protease [Dysgonomonas sp. 521]
MNKVFCIFRKQSSNPDKFRFSGNGFFIDNNGTFITAGHVFRENGERYIGFYEENEDIELTPLNNEKCKAIHRKIYNDQNYLRNDIRLRTEFQCAPEHKDVAIGKIDIHNTEFLSLIRKRPYEWDKLSVSFYCRDQNLTEMETELINGKIPNSFVKSYNVTFTFKDTRLHLAEIPYLVKSEDRLNYYNNCMLLNGDGKTYRGSSGSPIINQRGQVAGIVIGGDRYLPIATMLLARYVIKKSKKLIKLL